MSRRVEIAFRRAVTTLIPAQGAVLVAVSGGGDSMALLHLLERWAARRGPVLWVAHLDHALRRGSAADRRFVEYRARQLGLGCLAERRDVAALRRKDESPEEGARRVRRAFLLRAARRTGCRTIATGHTLDDQAETVLMRLARGAGPTALTGMAAAGPGPFVRPLLGLEREELRAWLQHAGLPYREDPSNGDLRFDRNRVRRLVLPVLAGAINPRAARNLVQAVRRFREDAAHLDGEALAALTACVRRRAAASLVLDAQRLGALAPPVGQRVARMALERAGADARRVGARHVAALLDLARGADGRSVDLPGGLTARRVRARVLLGKP